MGFFVTRNLRDALQYSRHPLTVRFIWDDPLRIDQQNNGERGYQVRLMVGIKSD